MICDDLAIVMSFPEADEKPRNAEEFLSSFTYFTEDDPDVALLDRLGYRPDSITFLQGVSDDGTSYSEIFPAVAKPGEGGAPRLMLSGDVDLVPGRYFIVDVSIGRKSRFATIRELFNYGFNGFLKQVEEDPVMWKPLLDDETPCGIFQIRQHGNGMIDGMIFDVRTNIMRLSIR